MPGAMGNMPGMSDQQKQAKTLEILTKGNQKRVKRDGSVLRSKDDIVRDYD